MPNERISMSKLKQLIALQTSNLSVRALARAVGLSVGAVSKYLGSVRASGIGVTEAKSLSESEIEQRVFGPTLAGKPGAFVAPDCAWIHGELKRHRHVTLQLLWEEYAGHHGAAAYRRSAFCQIYRSWEKRLKRSMRQRHFAGEKMFVDYAGRTVPIYGHSGEESIPGPPVCERDGGRWLCVHGSDAQRNPTGLAGKPRAGAGVLWGGRDDHREGQSSGGCDPCGSIRA
jgi:hypothetical protein